MSYKKHIIAVYENSIEANLSSITSSLKEAGIGSEDALAPYTSALRTSMEAIVTKWRNETKYVRTEYALQAFGDTYPESFLEVSLMIDAMVNILDDLFDEDLQAEERRLSIVEYLRIFAVYSSKIPNKAIQQAMSFYFNKLITLAIAEQRIMLQVKHSEDKEYICTLSTQLLMTRAFDIDIFIQIPMYHISSDTTHQQNLLKRARIFRALNILKKDIRDIEHDRSEGQETLVTWVLSHKEKYSFPEYNMNVTDSLRAFLSHGEETIPQSSSLATAYTTFASMIEAEIIIIQKESNKVP